MDGRRLMKIMAVGIIALMFTISGVHAANRDFNKAETIRIGSLGPVQLVPGIGIHNAAKMAVEEINAAGGINGRMSESTTTAIGGGLRISTWKVRW